MKNYCEISINYICNAYYCSHKIMARRMKHCKFSKFDKKDDFNRCDYYLMDFCTNKEAWKDLKK